MENPDNEKQKHNLPNTNKNFSDDNNPSVPSMDKFHNRYKLVRPIVFIALSLSILLGFVNGLLFDKLFLQDAWTIIHQMQMMLLLSLINANVKPYVIDLIIQCSFSALSIFLFPVKIFRSFPLIKQLYTVEPDQHLMNLGVTTGSTILSCIFLISILFILVLVHLLALKLFQGQRSETLKRLIPKMYSRVFIETFIFVMIASMFEIMTKIKVSIKTLEYIFGISLFKVSLLCP